MTRINPTNFLAKFLKKSFTQKTDIQEKDLLIKNDKQLDVVEIKTRKNESFKEVFEEMNANVPDRTCTIEEKNLAISYINRMLACDDIPDNLKQYWQNKKDVIEMEILNIKNEQKAKAGGETIKEVLREFSAFVNKYFELNENLNMDDKFENRMTYYSTYRAFCQRILACSDITEEKRAEFQLMLANADREVSSWESIYNDSKK